jgi:hypothetical protein
MLQRLLCLGFVLMGEVMQFGVAVAVATAGALIFSGGAFRHPVRRRLSSIYAVLALGALTLSRCVFYVGRVVTTRPL